jgi:uncharacterized alpha-E superfamily protein
MNSGVDSMDDKQVLDLLLEARQFMASISAKLETAVQRLQRVEDQMSETYATKEGLKRIEDKIDALSASQKNLATTEKTEAISARLQKTEDTLTWAIRGMLTAFGALAVSAIVYALKHG